MTTISRNILNIRLKKSMTQDELAAKIGASKQMISNWERGINNPSQVYIDKLAKVFNLEVSDLYREDLDKVEEVSPAYKKNDERLLIEIISKNEVYFKQLMDAMQGQTRLLEKILEAQEPEKKKQA